MADLSPREVADVLRDGDAQLVDVREPYEHEAGHIAGDLHIVLAVAEAGSMAKASTRLAISHPVVSKAISELEHTLGVSLFDRSSQGVEPTAYGRALLDAAVNVFDEMRQGFKRIEFLADPTSGELAVGCPEIILAGVLPAITEHFLGQHPRVQLRVIHADTALMQFDQLRKHNVELLIGRMPMPFVELAT